MNTKDLLRSWYTITGKDSLERDIQDLKNLPGEPQAVELLPLLLQLQKELQGVPGKENAG